jgi:two-component system, cell cycle sensor histidine kinase and response regulator CckA
VNTTTKLRLLTLPTALVSTAIIRAVTSNVGLKLDKVKQRKMIRNKIGFIKLIRLWGIVFLTALAVAIVGTDLVTTYHYSNIRVDNMRTDYVEQQKQMSKHEVERVVNMINYERTQSETLTRNKIKSRVYEAYAIAQHIYQQNKTAKSEAEIQQMIIEALRPIRFEHGSGYYFATRLDGVELLFADKPEMEGLNLLDLQDTRGRYVIKDTIEIAEQSGEGFYEYHWTKPQSAGRDLKKISFIKRFEPYDWFIGTGLYVDDIEEQIKATWMERINNIRFGKNSVGYLFAVDWRGKSLAHGAQPDLIGQNGWEWVDSRGNKTTQLLIAASKKRDGGYTSFWWRKPDTGKESPKIAYAKAVPEWELFVGSGVYVDDIEQSVTTLQAALNTQTKAKIISFIIIVVIALALFLTLFNLLSNRLRKDLNMFVSFFDKAAFSDKKIDRETVQFVELDQMAKSANKMITDRKKAEESLRESREKYKSIVDNIGIGVALISPSMEVIEMNQQMREWFPGHDLNKRPICYRTFNNPPREEICEYCPTCRTFEDGIVHESTIVTPYVDKTRNFRIVSSPLINSQGEVTAAIEMVEDITERLNLQAQLIQAQKMEAIGTLAGGVAHDYNNISSIIIGYSEFALESIDQSDPLHNDLMEILTTAKRSTNITRQLLAFARQQTIAPKVIDINDTMANILKMLRRLIGEDIDLAWLPGAEVWPVKIDPSQVDQILANLCVNARDAIADVGKVTIETRNISFGEDYCADHVGFIPGDFVLLAVSDDGSGMAPETLDKIFEPFFTTKSLGKGTGLGLSTVYGIVKQNNGFINVYSEPEKGTTFKIYLSRHTGESVEARHESTLENPLSRGETVLLVEDDGSILELGKRMLNNLGYTVLSAATPNEAISLAEEHDNAIDLLITDVIMPEMNGRELSEQLRTRYSNLKTLFMSGYTANVIAHRGVLEDGVCFMPKPFSKKDLAVKVREALGNDNS